MLCIIDKVFYFNEYYFIEKKGCLHMKKTISVLILAVLLLLNLCLLFKLHKENEYYKKVITDLGSEELIYFPELYSDGYIEQINVHNCMWAIETCECSLSAED